MPWRTCRPMGERLRFIARLLEGEKMALTWGSFAPIQVNLTECLLSDIAEDAVYFSDQLIAARRHLDATHSSGVW